MYRKQFSGNLFTGLAIIIQVIFSHEMLSEVEICATFNKRLSKNNGK